MNRLWMRNRREYGHTRPLWRIAVDFILMLVLAVAILYATDRVGPPNSPATMEAVDGDTLKKGARRIRLEGIDAPELYQRCWNEQKESYACGEEARRQLAGLIEGRPVTCQTLGHDQYQRTLSICRAGDVNLNAEMVRTGWAVAYFRSNLAYKAEELEARLNRRGLWRGEFERPENYRRSHPRARREDRIGIWDSFETED